MRSDKVKYITPECDNKSQAHDMIDQPGRGGMKAYCRLCNRTYYLRLNKNGAPEKRQYAQLFYRMIVQPNKPLYYKIHRSKMRLVEIS